MDQNISKNFFELIRISQAAQNNPLVQMLPRIRRLKIDAKENKLQSAVLKQPCSMIEPSSDSEDQFEKQEDYNLSESDVNTSDDKVECDIHDERKIEKVQAQTPGNREKVFSKKSGALDEENKRKEKLKFSEPVHATTDNCNYKLLHCPLVIWCIYLLFLTIVCEKAHGAVMKDTSYSCYDSESAGRSVQDYDKETVCHIPYLKSSRCDAPVDDTCPTSYNNFDLLTNMHCQYKCGVRENVVCLNTDDGMLFVCLPQDISCPIGFGWRISFNKANNYVEIILGQCQDRFYQEKVSRCYDACKDEHFSPDHIPDGLSLYRKGDSSHPQLLMCDYTTGYYNPDNKTSIKADSQFQFTIVGFCVDSPNPCSGAQMPLHNGTCVNHCQNGFERDPPDFICKQKNGKRNGSTVTPTQPPALTSTARYDPPYTVQDGTPVPSTDKTKNITNKVDDEKTTLEKVLPVIIIALLVCVGVGCLLFGVYLKNKKKNTSNKNKQTVDAPRQVRTKNENGNFNLDVGDNATLNVYYGTNATLPDMLDSSAESLLNLNDDAASFDGAEELSQEASSILDTRL